MKSPGTLQNPGDPIVLPTRLRSDEVDYECELAVVIGESAKMSQKVTPSTLSSVTPPATMSVPATGKSNLAAVNGVEEKASIHLLRSDRPS